MAWPCAAHPAFLVSDSLLRASRPGLISELSDALLRCAACRVSAVQVWGLVLGALTGVQLLVYATLVLCLGWGAQQEGPPAAKMAVDPLEASLARGKGRRRAGSQRQAKSGRLQQWPPPNVAWPEHNLSFPGKNVQQYDTVLYNSTVLFDWSDHAFGFVLLFSIQHYYITVLYERAESRLGSDILRVLWCTAWGPCRQSCAQGKLAADALSFSNGQEQHALLAPLAP